MYLFSRSGRMALGNIRESMAWAVGITEKANQITSLGVELWRPIMSPGNGMVSWNCFVEDLTALETAEQKLMVDEGYLNELERGSAFFGSNPVDDQVAQVLYGEADPSVTVTHAAVVESELAPGAFAKGVEAGIQIATRATELSGLPTMFLLSSTGKYGGVAWITGAASLQELERGEQASNSDPGFVELIDKLAAGVYLPAVTTSTIWTKIV
jgi:hypothetical protein